MSAVIIGATVLASHHQAAARPPSAVTKAQSTATIFVSVPPKVGLVTYVFGGKIWTARQRETIALPAGASQISLTAGSIITASVPSADGGAPIKSDYTVNRKITLESLTSKAIKDISEYLTPGAVIFNAAITRARSGKQDNVPVLVSPEYANAPDCAKISMAVRKFVKAHPEKVLEVVALHVGQSESCACEVVKAAIIASAADKELVAGIVETAIEVAPSKVRIIGQCAVAVAPDALSEVQAIVSKYGAVSGDSGLSAKGGTEKGGGDGDHTGEPSGIQHPSVAINELAAAVDRLSEATVNPFNVLGDIVTDSDARFVGSTSVRLPNPQRASRVRWGNPGAFYLGSQDVSKASSAANGTAQKSDDGGRVTNEDGHAERAVAIRASVIGEVKSPGKILLPSNGKIDILTAIALAGGYNEDANEYECILQRSNATAREAIKIHLRDIRDGKKPMVYVYEGDIVTIK